MNCLKCHKEIEKKDLYGLHDACFLDWFGLSRAEEFKDVDPKSFSKKSQSPQISKKVDTFFHGRYLKYSAKLGNIEFILKIQETEFPELPATEFLCNQIAEILGIEVPSYHLIAFGGVPTFVTRNFMQDHVGQLHHIYKFLPDGEENHSCQKILEAIINITGRPADAAKFVDICLFDSLIGNNDRHGRNLGIIETSKFKRLAPMYDNPSYIGIAPQILLGARFNISGSIWTSQSKEPKAQDYISEFSALGYGTIVTKFIDRAILKFSAISEAIESALLTKARKDAISRLTKQRIEEFKNARKNQ